MSLRGKAEAIHVYKGIVLCGLLRFARNDGIGVHNDGIGLVFTTCSISKLQNGSRGFFWGVPVNLAKEEVQEKWTLS